VDFEIIGEISNIEIIALGKSIRDRSRLERYHGKGKWRKMKFLPPQGAGYHDSKRLS
jgi:hypothetical protein